MCFILCRAKYIEELFGRRIEAPNKTHILDSIFMGYDNRVRPYYRGENAVALHST